MSWQKGETLFGGSASAPKHYTTSAPKAHYTTGSAEKVNLVGNYTNNSAPYCGSALASGGGVGGRSSGDNGVHNMGCCLSDDIHRHPMIPNQDKLQF